jgi:hypothetical protein
MQQFMYVIEVQKIWKLFMETSVMRSSLCDSGLRDHKRTVGYTAVTWRLDGRLQQILIWEIPEQSPRGPVNLVFFRPGALVDT